MCCFLICVNRPGKGEKIGSNVSHLTKSKTVELLTFNYSNHLTANCLQHLTSFRK